MASLENLTAAIDKLNGTVEQVVGKLGTPVPVDPGIEVATGRLNQLNDRLVQALAPPPPDTEPQPAPGNPPVQTQSAAALRAAAARVPSGLGARR